MAQFSPESPTRPPTKPEVGAIIMLALFFTGMMMVALFEEYSVYKLSVPIFLVSWAFLLIIHEFGHAVVAKSVGWKVEKVSIGTGKLIAKKRIWGLPTEFRAIPLSGFVLPRPTNLNRPQFKNFLIYAAGPGVEVLIILICWMLVGTETFFSRQPEIWLITVQTFCAAAALGAFITLVPISHQTEQGKAASDGLGMIMAWRIPNEEYMKWIRSSKS